MKLLRTQKVVYISCGEEHTAVLTKVRGSGALAVEEGVTGSFKCCRVAVVVSFWAWAWIFSLALL